MYKYKIKEISKGRFLLTHMRIIIIIIFFGMRNYLLEKGVCFLVAF